MKGRDFVYDFIKTIISAIQQWTKKEIKKNVNITLPAPDWNENDPRSINYIKNRTHWDTSKEIFIIPEMTVDISGSYETIGNNIPVLTVGQTYTVVLNGTTYQCVARRYGEQNAVIGNGTIYGDNDPSNNEPFSCDSYNGGTIYLNVTTPGSYTVSISVLEGELHKLDSKYIDLPDNIATMESIQEAIDVANNTKMNKENPVGTGSFSMNRRADSVIGDYSHTSGYNTVASGKRSHAEGYYTKALGDNSHAEGGTVAAHGTASYHPVIASGESSHAEGSRTTASGKFSHAEGGVTTASGEGSHAEGYQTVASGASSHAEGISTKASASDAHAEGYFTKASGSESHAEGSYTEATKYCSHSEGQNTLAYSKIQHVQGKFNIADSNDTYAHIVGNGTADNARSNAHTLDWEGNAWYQGDVFVGGINQDDGKKLATEEFVNESIDNIPTGVNSWNDLTDKPFGIETEKSYIVPEQVVDSYSADGSTYYKTIADYTLELGKKYFVNFNGTLYELECYDDGGNTTLGAQPYGSYSDYPFSVVGWGSNLTLCKLTNDSATISIYVEKEVVKQLDYNFMPEGYPKIKTEFTELVSKMDLSQFGKVGNEYEKLIVPTLLLEIGKTYKVLIDEVEYIVECFDDDGYNALGQPYGTGYTNYPFTLYTNTPGGNALIMNKSTSDGCTFALYEVHETVVPIDPMFLPSNIGGGTAEWKTVIQKVLDVENVNIIEESLGGSDYNEYMVSLQFSKDSNPDVTVKGQIFVTVDGYRVTYYNTNGDLDNYGPTIIVHIYPTLVGGTMNNTDVWQTKYADVTHWESVGNNTSNGAKKPMVCYGSHEGCQRTGKISIQMPAAYTGKVYIAAMVK